MARYTVFFHNMYRRFGLCKIYRVHNTFRASAVSIRTEMIFGFELQISEQSTKGRKI